MQNEIQIFKQTRNPWILFIKSDEEPKITCQAHAGQNFWARGYFVLTVGRDEATIRDYIRNREKEDRTFAKPHQSLSIVLRDSVTVAIENSECDL
jgi:hypothetical protein